jgi:hypothetical protein
MQRLMFVACIALMAACRGGAGGSLNGAMSPIPVFTPAHVGERSDAFTSDEIANPRKFSTYTWHLETEKTPEDVASFYEAQWPGAGRVEEDDTIHLRNPPLPDGESTPLGESVSIAITKTLVNGRTKFTIAEDVFAQRRP